MDVKFVIQRSGSVIYQNVYGSDLGLHLISFFFLYGEYVSHIENGLYGFRRSSFPDPSTWLRGIEEFFF